MQGQNLEGVTIAASPQQYFHFRACHIEHGHVHELQSRLRHLDDTRRALIGCSIGSLEQWRIFGSQRVQYI